MSDKSSSTSHVLPIIGSCPLCGKPTLVSQSNIIWCYSRGCAYTTKPKPSKGK